MILYIVHNINEEKVTITKMSSPYEVITNES